jgi:predicted dinucleotide-binding enzyme
MYCDENTQAKEVVAELITQLGWEPLDVGGLAQALHYWKQQGRCYGRSGLKGIH